MHEDNNIEITTYDKLLRAWENSMELTKNFELNSKEIKDEDVRKVFKEFAEDEGIHASQFRSMLLEYKDKR